MVFFLDWIFYWFSSAKMIGFLIGLMDFLSKLIIVLVGLLMLISMGYNYGNPKIVSVFPLLVSVIPLFVSDGSLLASVTSDPKRTKQTSN